MPKHSQHTRIFPCTITKLTRPDGANYYRVTLPKRLVESAEVGELIEGSFVLNKKALEIIFYELEIEKGSLLDLEKSV